MGLDLSKYIDTIYDVMVDFDNKNYFYYLLGGIIVLVIYLVFFR